MIDNLHAFQFRDRESPIFGTSEGDAPHEEEHRYAPR
jgi:hypothetical protein